MATVRPPMSGAEVSFADDMRSLMSHGSEVDTEKSLAVGIQVVVGIKYSACCCREFNKV